MRHQTALYIAVFSTLALAIGWHFRNYRGAASELATRLNQIPGLRDTRDRAFATISLLAVLFAAVLYVIAKHR